jgi:hypothetical protein
MTNRDIPDEYFSELQNRDDYDEDELADYDEAMEQSNNLVRVSSIAFACAWLFANDHVTLREYMDILDDAEAQFDSPLP